MPSLVNEHRLCTHAMPHRLRILGMGGLWRVLGLLPQWHAYAFSFRRRVARLRRTGVSHSE